MQHIGFARLHLGEEHEPITFFIVASQTWRWNIRDVVDGPLGRREDCVEVHEKCNLLIELRILTRRTTSGTLEPTWEMIPWRAPLREL